jgi:hypothetical protein
MKSIFPVVVAASAALFVASADAQIKPTRPASAAVPAAKPASAAQADPDPADPVNAAKAAAGSLAAGGWLVLLDRGDWGTAWETSSSVFRSMVPLASWMDGIPKVRAPLGKLIERTPAESMYKTRLQGRPDGEYVTVIFDAKFEQKQVQEVVTTVRDTDGRWRVTGYSTR